MPELDFNTFIQQWSNLDTEKEIPKILDFIMGEESNEQLLEKPDFIKDIIDGKR